MYFSLKKRKKNHRLCMDSKFARKYCKYHHISSFFYSQVGASVATSPASARTSSTRPRCRWCRRTSAATRTTSTTSPRTCCARDTRAGAWTRAEVTAEGPCCTGAPGAGPCTASPASGTAADRSASTACTRTSSTISAGSGGSCRMGRWGGRPRTGCESWMVQWGVLVVVLYSLEECGIYLINVFNCILFSLVLHFGTWEKPEKQMGSDVELLLACLFYSS